MTVDGDRVHSSIVDLVAGGRHISDWAWVQNSNGWSPAERDTSNGEQAAGDGRTIAIEGRCYSKGVGVHAPSAITLDLDRKCERFQSDVGVDDEMGGGGSVRFRINGDGEPLRSSTVLTGNDNAVRADVAVAGVETLELVVDNGGDGIGQDHADWAAAWLRCTG